MYNEIATACNNAVFQDFDIFGLSAVFAILREWMEGKERK